MWWEYGIIDHREIIDAKPWQMPPKHYLIRKNEWPSLRPKSWKRIPFEIVKKYGWYISVMGEDDYLIMPVFRGLKPMMYSARRLTNNGGDKYRYPPVGTGGKYVWISSNKNRLGKIVALLEGVADAAYVSRIVSTIGLLGSYISDEVVAITKGKIVILLFDGDLAGRAASMHANEKLPKAKPVFLPEGADPTDLTYGQLRTIIKKQTGVQL